mgnify:CR=1 FL=1
MNPTVVSYYLLGNHNLYLEILTYGICIVIASFIVYELSKD